MERDKPLENSSAAASSNPFGSSHQRNGRSFTTTEPLPRIPTQRQTNNNLGRPPRSLNSRSDYRRESRPTAARLEGDSSVNIPNIRFRTALHPESPTQASPAAESSNSNNSQSLSDHQALSLSEGAVASASSSSRGASPGSRYQHHGGQSSTRNHQSGMAAKGRNGASPRRSNGRGRHNNSSSNRYNRSSSYSLRVQNEDPDNDVDLTRALRASVAESNDEHNPSPSQNFTSNGSGVSGFRGLGTEEQPLELLNDSDAVEVVEDATAVSRDEEIARQLQQEEWERASTPGPPLLAGFRNPHHQQHPSRLHFLQAIHGAMGSDNPSNPRGRRGAQRVPSFRGSRHGALPRAALQLPDLFDILPPELVEMILGGGQMLPDENDYEALLEMGEQIGAVSRGLPQSDIDKIPTQKHAATAAAADSPASASSCDLLEGPPSCSICLCEFEQGDTKRVLPCEHQLHKQCIDQWLKTNATCPVCRKDVREG